MMESVEGVYRVQDNIRNFMIRIRLQRVTATRLRDIFQESHPTLTGGLSTEIDVLTVKWQEKYFSQEQEETFADEANCSTTLEMKYHNDILKLRSRGGRPNKRIFTYTNVDTIPSNIVQEYRPILIGGNEVSTFFTTHQVQLVRRRHVDHSYVKPIEDSPSVSNRISHRCPTMTLQVMYLVADLRRMDGIDECDEHVLCQITIDNNNVMTIKPDITRESQPWYRVENRHRELYEYCLEHVSIDVSSDNKLIRQNLSNELYQLERVSRNIGDKFQELLVDSPLKAVILGNIVSAEDYDYDNIYVRVELDYSDDWEMVDKCDDVVTQICRKSKHKTNIAYFSCPLEYNMVYKGESIVNWPNIIVEVCSMDVWDRHRILGYGYFTIPDKPGKYNLRICTWKPHITGIVNHLRDFFIGGTPVIQNNRYISTSNGSRYGYTTDSTGTVTIQLYVIHQHRI